MACCPAECRLARLKQFCPAYLRTIRRAADKGPQRSRRWIDDPTALVIRLEDGLFELAQVADASHAGSQLCGYDCAEVQTRGRPLDKYFEQSRILVTSGRGDETVGIQYELAHRRSNQSIRASFNLRRARTPFRSSRRKVTRLSAISTASRSVAAPKS